VAYNDAKFDDDDFRSIQDIGNSEKKSEWGKTGRFGVGFRAVYHITDMPSLVSADRVVFFDPHCKFVGKKREGVDVRFQAKESVKKFPDQYRPYQMFGCDMTSHFTGTLLRLPLRSEAQAGTSKLSDKPYTPEKIKTLFEDFQKIADTMLLFLQHVEEIELLVWEPEAKAPTPVFSVRITNVTFEVQEQRRRLSEWRPHDDDDVPLDEELRALFTLELDTFDSTVDDEQVRTARWLVSQSAGGHGTEAARLAAESLDDRLAMRLVPWGGVAARVPDEQDQLQGQIFCTLPLPQGSSTPDFPVHTNGFFELSENRREIWFGTDMQGEGKKKADWNVALLEDCIVPAYTRLIVHVKRLTSGTDGDTMSTLSSLLPKGQFDDAPWSAVPKQLYTALCTQPVLLSTSGEWVSPANALMADSTVDTAIIDILSKAGHRVVQTSETEMRRLDEMLKRYLPDRIQDITPSYVRQLLRDGNLDVQQSTVELLFKYCVGDLGDAFEELVGLSLVPLADGNFRAFASGTEEEKIYQCTQRELELVTAEGSNYTRGMFVNPCACSAALLQSDAALSQLNLYTLLPDDIIKMLEKGYSGGADIHPGMQLTSANLHASDEWLTTFWEWVTQHPDVNVRTNLYVVPASIGQKQVLCKMDPSQPNIIDPNVFVQDVLELFGLMGCAVVHEDVLHVPVIKSHLICDKPADILACILRCKASDRLLACKSSNALRELLQKDEVIQGLDEEDEELARALLRIDADYKYEDLRQALRALPLFSKYGQDEFICVRTRGYLPPPEVDQELLRFSPEPIFNVNNAEHRLANKLNADQMTVEDFIVSLSGENAYLEMYEEDMRLLDIALQCLVRHCGSQAVLDHLVNAKIIPVGQDGCTECLSCLYDIDDKSSPFRRARHYLLDHFPSWTLSQQRGEQAPMKLTHQLQLLRTTLSAHGFVTIFSEKLTDDHAFEILELLLEEDSLCLEDEELACHCVTTTASHADPCAARHWGNDGEEDGALRRRS
jgi:sacsin